jgi:hypothetical protein
MISFDAFIMIIIDYHWSSSITIDDSDNRFIIDYQKISSHSSNLQNLRPLKAVKTDVELNFLYLIFLELTLPCDFYHLVSCSLVETCLDLILQ